MKKKYSFKILVLFAITFLACAEIIYLLYRLYLSKNPLTIPLICAIAAFSLYQHLIYCTLLKHAKTSTIPSVQDTNTSESIAEPIQEEVSVDSSMKTMETEDVLPSEEYFPADALGLVFSHKRPTIEMDIISAAKDAMESLTPFAEAQNIKLHLSATNDKLMIMAEPESIRILFRNIIDNSIKYMGRAGHMIITISLLGDDIFVILKDTGKGLSEDETTHVFELNFQGSNRVSGNGLGLTQTKMIVEAFGGTIYAKSSPENGMAIYIQLPVSGKSTDS